MLSIGTGDTASAAVIVERGGGGFELLVFPPRVNEASFSSLSRSFIAAVA
jgi:hypothetical protein